MHGRSMPRWGYTRIQSALKNLNHRVARSTIATILKAQGIAAERRTSWQAFLRAHWNAVVAADFFTTKVWTVRGLVTYYTLFVIDCTRDGPRSSAPRRIQTNPSYASSPLRARVCSTDTVS